MRTGILNSGWWGGRGLLFGTALMMLLWVSGCREGERGSSTVEGEGGGGGRIRVTCTTTMVSDLVREVGGDEVEVQGLMGPGVDPHLYKASASDVAKLQKAEVIFYNGLLLEGKLQEVFNKMAATRGHVHAVAGVLPEGELLVPPEMEGHPDPHIWFDVDLWRRCVSGVVSGLSGFAPDRAETFKQRGAALDARLRALHQWALSKAAELPEEKRILVTSHDAYNYFGRAYGFRVVGLQGISTVDEISLAAMASMVDFIKANGVKAIFVESSVSPAAIKRISQDAGVVVGGELFSDAMGTPGEMESGHDLGTYEGMVRHNLETIVGALK